MGEGLMFGALLLKERSFTQNLCSPGQVVDPLLHPTALCTHSFPTASLGLSGNAASYEPFVDS